VPQPRVCSQWAFSCLSWGLSRALLASALVLTFWQRHAGRGTVDLPLAPWRARSPVEADMTRGIPERWLRQATGAGARPGLPCGRGLAAVGRRWCRLNGSQAHTVTACLPARAGCEPQAGYVG
jgi:hypothetical protein